MKKYFSLLILFVCCKTLSAQIVSTPSKDLEYCPTTNITFSVTIAGYEPFVFGWTNSPIIVSTNYPPNTVAASTTFSFVGRFQDVNIAQTFGVMYKRQNKADTTEYITFKKIKSLYYPTQTGSSGSSPCQQFKANQISITAPRCQIVNVPISVIPTKWSTYGEGSDFCWGSISTYEYLLPNQWSIGFNVSNGSTWILGGASATVTSDLANGVNGVILIRPTNNCGAGLANNIPPAQIPILRPAPTLTIFHPQGYLCNGQSANYSISGMPTGATVQWALVNASSDLPTTLASIVGASNTPTITVQAVASGQGLYKLRAVVSNCGFSDTVRSPFPQQIGIADPPNLTINSCRATNSLQALVIADNNNPRYGTTGYIWNIYGSVTYNGTTSTSDANGGDLYRKPFISPYNANNTYTSYLTVRGITACGNTAVNPNTYQIVLGPNNPGNCSGGGGGTLRATPNPVSNNFTVETIDKSNFTQVRVFDKIGIIRKQVTCASTNSLVIDITGLTMDIYTVKVLVNGQWETVSIIKQ